MPPKISKRAFDQTPDRDLCDWLNGCIRTSFEETGACSANASELEAIMTLPRGLRAVYSLCVFNGEVLNGGFQQYFTNSNGLLASAAVEACRLVGAHKHAEILDKGFRLWEAARKLWESAKGDEDQEERTWEIFETEIGPEFDTLDPAIDALRDAELLFDLLTDWLRRHPDECVTEP